MGKRILAALPAAALLLLAGCTSLSDSMFLRRLDNPVKSRAVTEQGIALYQLVLVTRGEYERVDEVRRFFEVALRFDPNNLKAQAYLELVDSYRVAETRKRVREAELLLKKGKRSREEDYTMCQAVARAYQLAPDDGEVAGLRRQTAEVRGTLVTFYLESGRAARTQAMAGSDAAAREKLYLEAFRSFNRALAVDPQNRNTQSEKDSLRSAVNGILSERLAGAKRLVGEAKFAEARKEAVLLEELNRRLDHLFDREVEELGYTLYYRWARSLFERRDYPAAQARADSALAVRRTEEAATLRRKIQQARRQSEGGVSYEAALEQVDRLVAQGDLAGAYRRIDTLARATQDRARLAALEARREKVRAQLPTLYEKAVGYYRAEDFQNAVELLETVLAIDVEYEQAAEYLDKARTKKKLLEQYGGEG
jgi:hypothetical protein